MRGRHEGGYAPIRVLWGPLEDINHHVNGQWSISAGQVRLNSRRVGCNRPSLSHVGRAGQAGRDGAV